MTTCTEGGIVRIAAVGELDLVGGPQLLAAIERACDVRAVVRLDLTRVSFLDLTTAQQLLTVIERRRAEHRPIRLLPAPAVVERTMRVVATLRTGPVPTDGFQPPAAGPRPIV